MAVGFTGGRRARVLCLSAFHDYRTAKRASIHQLADGFVQAGYDVSFASVRFSLLSRLKGDSRLPLWSRANRVETVNSIDCYLWRTALHPFQTSRKWLRAAMPHLYRLYARLRDDTFDRLVRNADYVILESGPAVVFLRRLHRLNPTAKIIYYAADRLETIGAHASLGKELEANAGLIHHYALRSPRLAPDFPWAKGRLYRAEFGIDAQQFADVGPSPYPSGKKTAISVGSMLFDERFFKVAPARFPDVDFHVIGCGTTFQAPPNVTVHPEMTFRATLPYVKHATVGIAPYLPAPGAEYLADSSLKMAQYAYFGLPTVCPAFAVGDAAGRFGYQPGNEDSMVASFAAALDMAGQVPPRRFPEWCEVAQRILEPELYPETRIDLE